MPPEFPNIFFLFLSEFTIEEISKNVVQITSQLLQLEIIPVLKSTNFTI
jgi:hypothetical protein